MDLTTDPSRILIVDDDPVTTELFKTILEAHDRKNVLVCGDSREVMGILAKQSVSVLLLDLNMPHISGQELLPQITSEHPEIPVIILTSEDNVDTAVECMKFGAFDFMAKPIDRNRLVNAVSHAVKIRELQDEVYILSTPGEVVDLQDPDAFGEIITVSPNMRKIFRYLEAAARSPKAVLVTGESGTGKELVARVVHRLSGKTGDFVPVNVSGLDDTIFSDTLFGHTRGAFTGAESQRAGLIEKASGGTLFLDEIGDLQIGAQVKLLRLLQEGEYYPLGSDRAHRSGARIVAATNADLHQKQKDGTFRKDLYYRLMAHHAQIPPLRERREDIPPLAQHFLTESAAALGRPKPGLPRELIVLLSNYAFPGNVRELQSVIYDAVSRNEGGTLSVAHIRDYLRRQQEHNGAMPQGTTADGRNISYAEPFPSLKEVEDFFISEALHRAEGNQSLAASMLGVSQSTLSRRLRKSFEEG